MVGLIIGYNPGEWIGGRLDWRHEEFNVQGRVGELVQGTNIAEGCKYDVGKVKMG